MSSCTWPSTPHPTERILQEAPGRTDSFFLWGDPEAQTEWLASVLPLSTQLTPTVMSVDMLLYRSLNKKGLLCTQPTATSVVLLSRDQDQLCLCAERWSQLKKLWLIKMSTMEIFLNTGREGSPGNKT